MKSQRFFALLGLIGLSIGVIVLPGLFSPGKVEARTSCKVDSCEGDFCEARPTPLFCAGSCTLPYICDAVQVQDPVDPNIYTYFCACDLGGAGYVPSCTVKVKRKWNGTGYDVLEIKCTSSEMCPSQPVQQICQKESFTDSEGRTCWRCRCVNPQ